MRAELSLSVLVSIVLQVLVVLCDIHTVNAANGGSNNHEIACDNSENTLKCKNATISVICITVIDVGMTKSDYCARVPRATPNNNCVKKDVENYILKKCNGEKIECKPFYRNTDISEYCERAFKYVVLQYDCVSSLSKCSTIQPKDEIMTTKPLPSLSYNIMAQGIKLSTKILPTKTTKTSAIDENQNSSSRHDEIPATTAQKPGNEIPQNSSFSSPRPSSRVPDSRKKVKMCTRKTKSMNVATISPKPGNMIPETKPKGGRNSGYSLVNNCSPWKFYLVVVLCFMFYRLFSIDGFH